MIPALLLAGAIAALGSGGPKAIKPAEETQRAQHVEEALDADLTLLDLHRRYLALLDEEPDFAATENVYNEVAVLRQFRHAVGSLEEAIAARTKTKTQIYAYYASLNRNATLRRHADAIHRIGWTDAHTNKNTLPALAYLRANPETAIRFLENPLIVAPTPDALYPMRAQLREHSETREELRHHFTRLHEEAEAHRSLFPAWRMLYAGESDLAKSYRYLSQYFARYPHYFWIYHRRMSKLAASPSTMEWVQHFHARIRRDPNLHDTYFAYLQILRRDPARKRVAAQRWDEAHGPAGTWPPEGRPPSLDPIAASEQPVRHPYDPRAAFVIPTKPQRPAVGGQHEIALPARPQKEESTESPSETIGPIQ